MQFGQPICNVTARRAAEGRKRPIRFWKVSETSHRYAGLFQWQEQLRDRLVLRHLREKREALAVERKIPYLLPAGRQPLAIQLERGRLQVVGVTDDAKHRAASARYHADLDRRAIHPDRLVGPDAEVDPVVGG